MSPAVIIAPHPAVLLHPLGGFASIVIVVLAGALLAALVRTRRLAAAVVRAEAASCAAFVQPAAGVACIGLDGSFRQVNDRLCEMLGYTSEELLRLNLSQLLHPGDRAASEEGRARLLASPWEGPSPAVERRYVHKSGRVAWALLSVSAVRDASGAADGFLGIVQDITEVKRAQEDLELKTALLTTQQETSLDAILMVDQGGRILSFNRKFTELWGIDEALARTGEDEPVLHAVVGQMKDPEAFLAKVRYLYEQKDEHSYDELETNDGRTIDRYSAPVIGPNDQLLGRIWYFREVTERRRGEIRLRESEERFRQMAQTIGEVFWMASRDAASILYISPAFETVWGRPTADLYADPNTWLVAIHPDDTPQVMLALEGLAKGTPYDIEYGSGVPTARSVGSTIAAIPCGTVRVVWS